MTGAIDFLIKWQMEKPIRTRSWRLDAFDSRQILLKMSSGAPVFGKPVVSYVQAIPIEQVVTGNIDVLLKAVEQIAQEIATAELIESDASKV